MPDESKNPLPKQTLQLMKRQIQQWSRELGFADCAISDTELSTAEQQLNAWLTQGYHGSMEFMARHGHKRSQPEALVPGTLRVISVRMDYYPESAEIAEQLLQQPELAYISRYALGRDYHKLMRQRLQKLATLIADQWGTFGYRAFVDSAPVLEKPLAAKAGLGWVGKHSNLLTRQVGSWYFLGELYVDIPLPVDAPVEAHCGDCTACIQACPTDAIVQPYVVDARRCISYLTIENRESIPEQYRKAMGNRIYGCDDCQIYCPWNRFTQTSDEEDFHARHGLNQASLVDLFSWQEAEFLTRMEGSPIRRIGYACWLRNIAVALGNAPGSNAVVQALKQRVNDPSPLVREHVAWALTQHEQD